MRIKVKVNNKKVRKKYGFHEISQGKEKNINKPISSADICILHYTVSTMAVFMLWVFLSLSLSFLLLMTSRRHGCFLSFLSLGYFLAIQFSIFSLSPRTQLVFISFTAPLLSFPSHSSSKTLFIPSALARSLFLSLSLFLSCHFETSSILSCLF